jgi:hypothetical protein
MAATAVTPALQWSIAQRVGSGSLIRKAAVR